MYEIICYGLGGQGIITASKILAAAAIFYEKKYASVGVKYGTQRRGGVVRAFVRIDDKPIFEKSLIYKPDCIVVAHPTFIEEVDITAGLKEDGVAVLNTVKDPNRIDLGVKLSRIGTLDANKIAEEVWGVGPILLTSMPMLGAFCATSRKLKLESVIDAVRRKWSGMPAERNVDAIKKACNETKVVEFSR